MKTIVSELLALFVDDAGLAVATVVWLGVAWLLFHLVPAWSPVILFAGLAVILLESVFRTRRTP